ncbi:PD-(D/E)XK nuclease family protein [Arthrobacter sp. Marseille-P9274]|uniref:PD-(D/E)XK nuclease family protein n=1 Tax=Arthrobacter sp. Marseille-P9274 TaxID=2866572 RepID=UPI0021C9F538|nr:PD-(D/E)XK nuclease family protein [Arthrobacter sp. Marseille-P9274]
MMRVEFGWFLDRAPWAFRAPGLNAVRVGRLGLTALLQTRLGTTRPETTHTLRVNQYAARLRALDAPGAWFHRSFAVDPWGTAQDLLYARDELVANGWDGSLPDDEVSDLVHSLAGLEQVGLPLAPSLADDVSGLVSALDSPLPLGISVIELQHPSAALPAIWRTILGKLAARGVRVQEPHPQAEEAPIITVLETETEWEAAEHAARWLAAGERKETTAVVASRSTAVLDQHLSSHALPRLGISEKSAWRAQDQIVPLFMEVIWGPVNVQLLGEFLSLPLSPGPVRAKAARALLKALAEEPGTGGAAWEDALRSIADDEELGPGMATELDALFSGQLLVEDNGVSGADIVEKSRWLAGRLGSLAARDESSKTTSAQLQSLLTLLDGMPRVSRPDLRRMISSVVTETSSPFAAAEASPWLRLNHLNELMDDVDDVLWWGFQSSSPAPGRRWEERDVAALARLGVELPSPESLAALQVAQTVTAASRCKNLLIIQTTHQDGERVEGNPLLEALVAAQPVLPGPDGRQPGIAELVKRRKVTPGDVNNGADWALAGRSARLVPVPAREAAAPPLSFDIGQRPDLRPDSLSFSQLGNLIGCTLAWVLDRKVRLHVADAGSVPGGNKMIGTFMHKVVEELHRDLQAANQSVPTPDQVAAKIDQLLPQLASELLLPGRRSGLKHLHRVVGASVLKFFTTLSKAGIVIQSMEQKFEKDLALIVDGAEVSIPVTGSADVVGIDADGQRAVIDLKWHNRDKYRLAEVREGKSLQLTLYQWALNDDGDEVPDSPTAYYLLKQGTFASTAAAFGNPIQAQQKPAELWGKAIAAAEFSINEVVNGRVAAGPLLDAALAAAGEPSGEELAEGDGRLYGKPPCKFCDFSRLCGLKGDFS